MPTYEYQCECGERVERVNSMADMKKKVKCPKCGKMAPRAIACPTIQCRYSYMERVNGNPRVTRGKG